MPKDNVIIEKISAGGVVQHDGKYLVISWRSQGTIELPKGTVEPGESTAEACIREVREETGYNVRIVRPLNVASFTYKWHDGKTYHKTVHYYLMHRTDNAKPSPSREAQEDFTNIWLEHQKAVEKLSYEDMREAVRMATQSLKQN